TLNPSPTNSTPQASKNFPQDSSIMALVFGEGCCPSRPKTDVMVPQKISGISFARFENSLSKLMERVSSGSFGSPASLPGAAFSSEGNCSSDEKSCDPETCCASELLEFPLSSLALRVRAKMSP